ncbi:MAG: TonB-dependent receptor [Acidobacteriota bacterium]|nr:TonB-dependent receptor [Acidobacteriota bacterium]
MASQTCKHFSLPIALIVILAILAVFTVGSLSVNAQVAGATLSGTVIDPSGGFIANAEVSIKNLATALVRTVSTDSAGFYSAPNLLPGDYEVTTKATGFATRVQTGLALTVGAQQVLNYTLSVGQISEQVQVTSEAPAVQLASSTISNTVDPTTVRELPLNGRDWTLLAALQPGINALGSMQQAVSSGYNRGNRGYGTQLTISGARPQQNNYRIDGISVNDYANGGPGSVLGSTLGVDAIQEFSVLSSTYSAEYGRTSGGVINAVTRSGTNGFHGDVYELLRNSAFDARNFFDGPKIPPFKRNQFGVAVSGPIRRDRTFFFGDYEGIRQSLGVTAKDIVPSADARNGLLNFADPSQFPQDCIATAVPNQCAVTVDPLVKPYLPLWPVPSPANLIGLGNVGNFFVSHQQVTTENFATGRVDHKISDRDNIFVSYQYDKALLTLPDNLNTTLNGNSSFRQFASIEESHIFNPEIANNFRVGYNRVVALNAYGVQALNPLATDKSLGAVPGQNAPQIGVSGLQFFFGGLNAASHYNYYWNSFQGYDDAFVTKGIHALKFGVAVERIDFNLFGLVGPGGQYSFGSLARLLTNRPTNFVAALPTAITPRGLRQSIFGTYVQDDIRWRPSLTLNLGVRYEMSTVPTEAHGKLTALRNITDTAPHLGDPFFSNPTLHNFEPRIGFAWDPFRNGKTSVRGGFGIFDVLPLPYEFIFPEISDAPFFLQGRATALSQGDFPTRAFDLIAVSKHLRTPYIEPNPHRNYVMQWNLNVQRELLPNLSAMIAYVGSRGVHQPFHPDDINIVLPTLTPQGYLWPCTGGFVAGICTNTGEGTSTLNPVIGRMDSLMWASNSFYHGLQLQVSKRMSHGFQIQGSFTWGKAIDEGSNSVAGDPFQNSISSQFFFDRKLRRGPADFNVARNLVINYIWQVPTPRSMPSAASWVLGGWQVGGIFQASTGVPFTPILGGDPLGLNSSDPWDFPNRSVGAGCKSGVNPGNVNQYIKVSCFSYPIPSTLLGNTGRNSLTGPGLENFDFSLYKNNYIKRISETFNIQFRAEFFNVFNRANFNPPIANSTIFDQGGTRTDGAGSLDSTSTPSRQIQFALKVMW